MSFALTLKSISSNAYKFIRKSGKVPSLKSLKKPALISDEIVSDAEITSEMNVAQKQGFSAFKGKNGH